MGALGSLVPLIILFAIVGGVAFVGYQIYLWSQQMGDRARNHMEKKHMSFTKEGGLKVGVKELKDEAYADKTQNVLVNVWNNASFPNYKSNVGWNSSAQPDKKAMGNRPSLSERNSSTQSTSSSLRPSQSHSSSTANVPAANLAPTSRSNAHRSSSPVPGSFD